MAEEVSDVVDAVIDHGRALQAETPGHHRHILGKTHGLEHLRTEDSRVADFDPLLELWVEAEDFETGLGVWVVGGLVAELLDADFGEEDLHQAEQVVQANATVHHDTLDLVELSQMGSVQCLVTEDTIDGEVLHWFELLLLGLQVEHLGANGSGMRPEDVLHGLFLAPAGAIAERSWQAILVSVPYALTVLFGNAVAGHRCLAEESVLQVTGGMALRLEQRVKVPE